MHYADLQVTEVAAMVLSLDQGLPDIWLGFLAELFTGIQ